MNGLTARHGLHGLACGLIVVSIILASLASAAAQAVGGLAGPVPVGAQVVQSTPTTVLAALPGTGTIVANPYGAMFIQGASVSGNTISNLQPNVTIQLGTTAGTADSYAKIDFQGFNWGPGTVLTIRSGAAGQKLVLYNALAGASSISGTLLAQGGNGAAPPAIHLWNPSGFAVGLGGTITAPSGLTLDALGDTWTTGQDIVNAGSIDGGSSLILHGANINGSGAFKGNSTVVATFGSANNAVNGAHFLANGLQLFPSTGSDVLLTLNDYGNAPQYINVKVNGNARLSMPSAWPNGSTSPPNNPPVPPGGVRPAGVPDPTYGAGSSIIQATGSMTLDKGTSNDFVFPGGIVLKSGGTLDLNGVIVNQGWTTNGQAFQGTYFEAPNVVSSAGNIQVLTNDRNWVNFSTMPHAPVRTWTLARAADGSAQYVPADSAAPHLNTYSTLIEAAAAGQCWVCLVNSVPLDTQAPLVSITSPAAGSTLSSVVSLNASASDNIGVARVDFLANGTKFGSSTTAPYTFSWDTTRVSDGSVIISASAYDAAGNSTTASINANISNAPAPAASSQPTLTVTSSNPATGVPVRVYPADLSGGGDGTASFTRTYNANARVWVSAALRSGSNYFVKWQKDGVDYDTASTTSVVADTNHTLTAVYETPSCSGVAVYPGIDSLKNAVAAYPAGTTYCIKAGIHRMNSQVLPRTNDKYIGESGAILNGSKVLTSFVQSGSYWVATGQTQQEPPFAAVGSDGWPVCSAAAPACIYPEMVFLDGQDLWQVTSLADLAPGRFYFDYASDLIYLADNPTGHLVEATTGSGGIVGNTDGASDSVTVKNLVFEKFGGGEVSLYAHNALKAVAGWRVENNEFRLISFMAVANFGNGVVRNSYIHHNGRLGIVGNGTLEGNVISYNNTHGWEAGTDAGPTKFHGTSGLVLRGNIVANNVGKGIWADFDNINVTYENNVVENNSLMGILHEVGCAAVIRYNVLRGNNSANAGRSLSTGAQLFTRSSKDLDIYGNDVTATSPAVHGIGVYGDFINGQPQTYTGTNCGTILMQNIQVHDNVVRLDVGQLNGNPWGASYSSVYFSNNTYFLKDLTGSHFHYNGGPWAEDPYQAAGGDVTGKFYQW